MFGRKKAAQLQLTVDQCLSAVVVRNPKLQEEVLASGSVRVKLPYLKPRLLRLFSAKDKKTFVRRFDLDELGSALWPLCDGKHTVEQLIDFIVDAKDLEKERATQSMIAFLQVLMSRGLIGLVVPEQADSQA